MLPKRDQMLVSVNILHMKSLVLFCVAFCFQDIHANNHCDSTSDTGSVCVTITNPPRANITDNEVMDMRCRWDTTQYNFFRWTFNGSVLAPEHDGIFNSEMTFNTLSIRGSPQVHGEYRCWVTRKTSQTLREFAPLFIYYFPRIIFEEPINRNNPTTTTLRVGESLSYNCTATNQDQKMWADRYQNPILNSTDGRITVSTGRTDMLTINAVNHDDAKEYYCFAFVYFFNNPSSVIQERHLFRPVEVHGAPTIHCYVPSKAVTPGSLVSFVCKVQGYPGPVTISWDGSRARTDVSNVGIRNKNFAFSNIVNAWNSTLSFKDFVEVNDSGLYHITAQNMHGEISAMVELQVLHFPGTLMQPKVVLLNATRVRVSWKEPDNKDSLGLLYYMVLYGIVGSQRQQVNVSVEELQVELTVLPVTEYYFVVGAVNRLGTGDLSHRETITTNVSVPVAPVSVTVDMSTVTPESAVVTWSPLTGAYTGGHDIVQYIVSYKRVDEEWSVAKSLHVKPDVSQVTVMELEPLSTYITSVKGENVLGEGFPAESQMFTTPVLHVPGSPSEVTALKPSSGDSSAELYVCWTPGPDSYHIQTYQLSVYQRQNGTQLDLFKAVNVAAESVDSVGLQKCALVSGLQTDSCYWFSVAAHNAVGTSNASRPSDSSGCTISGLTSGVEAILKEPQVLAPIVVAAVLAAVLILLCATVCIVRRKSKKKAHGLYETTDASKWKTSQQQSADGCSSQSTIRTSSATMYSPRGHPDRAANQSMDSQDNALEAVAPSVSTGLYTTAITPDSGIPILPMWDEIQLGPAARYKPPQGSLVDNDNSNEAEKLIQWTIGPAHESRDTPPIVDRSVSVDPSDSGLDYGEDLSTFDRQVSNPGEYGSEMAIQYTDNVAYCVVGQQAGTSEQSRGMPKQPNRVDNKITQQLTGVTEWDARVPDRPLGVMLRQDPNCRDKEFVTFRQAPRVPPRTHTSNSLQTSL